MTKSFIPHILNDNDLLPTHTTSFNYTILIPGLLSSLNWHSSARALRDSLPLGKTYMDKTDFLNVMVHLGYAARKLTITGNETDIFPCLWVPQNKNQNPRILKTAHKSMSKGKVYTFLKITEDLDVVADKSLSAANTEWFAKLIHRFKSTFKQVLLASFVINILALVSPLFMMAVYDKVIGAHAPETLYYLITGAAIAIAIEFSLRLLRAKSMSWFGARIDYLISNAIFEHLLFLPPSYTERASVTAQISRLKSFESVRDFFIGPMFLMLVEIPFTLILIIAIFMISGPIAMIPLITTALYACLILGLRTRIKAHTAHLSKTHDERQNLSIEILNKHETLRHCGGFEAWIQRFEKVSGETAYAGYRYTTTLSLLENISHGMVIAAGVATIYFSIHQIWDGHMSMGALIAILIMTWRTLSPLQTLGNLLPRIGQIKNNIKQINRLMTLTPERNPYITPTEAPTINGEVEFHNVGLRYTKDSDPVFAGLSFTAKPGQLVAIVGNNGSGKSTILKLAEGLYHPQAGGVRIDGINIRQIDPIILRQSISYLTQDPEFLSGTIRDNLKLVAPMATDEEIKAALAKADFATDPQSLPKGLDTQMNTNTFPHAFRRHVSLARMYLQDNPIVLCDEMPYEFLNSQAGATFKEYLLSSKGVRTIFYVTYRQDYIDMADIVIHLYADGRPEVTMQKGKT